MGLFRVEIAPQAGASGERGDRHLVALLREAGLAGVRSVHPTRLFLLGGRMDRRVVERLASDLLADPVTECATVLGRDERPAPAPEGRLALEVHLRPGVMDPVAESTLVELRAEGLAVDSVRTARRYVVGGEVQADDLLATVRQVLANDCIEEVVAGTAGVRPAPQPPIFDFRLRSVALQELDDEALQRLSRTGHLFLSREEMQAIQAHFRARGRDPTDLELETLAQTWSEHCVHKTLKSRIRYRGAPLPTVGEVRQARRPDATEERVYGNLLKETIARATEELIAAGRGPQCLSVFQDNAGVIGFDAEYGIAFKVETHNHPSAIEPYGGAATGIGGVIRDVLGCGLGAKPIANTDVFCVAPSDWPHDRLPKGVLHPRRVLRGIARGVADYGNRMGIPTVNGAICFDPRYLGNPLVYCGCIGLIPRTMIHKAVRRGDLIVLLGGRTGRDGIHGATFSSAELTDAHGEEFSHAVQIGNAITEKRVTDALLQARDAAGGCLYSAVTDCGAGGLSSAVGEMAEHTGAVVELEKVPLKYAGLRYDEIWISEAQERMVVAVPRANLDRFLALMAAEEVEATVIGAFDNRAARDGAPAPALHLRYHGQTVGELDLAFLHHGVPDTERGAEWWPAPGAPGRPADRSMDGWPARLLSELARPNTASKEWVIRQYDHEVQGASVVKPLLGPGRGPGDAAVLRPRLDSRRGLAVGCGLASHLADVDPYWMAAAAVDEAVRNVVCVGADPQQTAILDNFCWGRSDDPHQLGALVRACQACYDASTMLGVPFISGKDSLNNEFALDSDDIEPLLETLRTRVPADTAWLAAAEARIRQRGRLAIPSTLLISGIAIVPDVERCVTPDLKRPEGHVFFIGGLPQTGFALAEAAAIHQTVARLIHDGLLSACHDVSDGGWLTALAEMAIAGDRGVDLAADPLLDCGPFEGCCAAYVVEMQNPESVRPHLTAAGVRGVALGTVRADRRFGRGHDHLDVSALQAAWCGPSAG